jgi:hypothetical protein
MLGAWGIVGPWGHGEWLGHGGWQQGRGGQSGCGKIWFRESFFEVSCVRKLGVVCVKIRVLGVTICK